MFALLWALIIGLVVGALAKLFMPGKDPGGIFVTMIIGIAGSIGATFLGQLVGWYKQGNRPASSCPSSARCCFFGFTG